MKNICIIIHVKYIHIKEVASMSSNNSYWEKQSKTFDESANYYDKYRPSYPKELIDDLIEKSGITMDSKILEIGAGSGKATELFVNRGFNMTCIEPGENLVKEGERKFHHTNKVKYYNTRFEDWNEISQNFDLVISAQAFHWVPKPLGYEKCANSLKNNKKMGLFWNYYISNEEQVDKDLEELISKYPIMYIASKDDIKRRIYCTVEEIKISGYFKEPLVLKYLWKQNYTKEEYIGFIRTGNGYLSLNSEERLIVENKVGGILDKNGGCIERPYLCVCYLAEKI